MSQLPPFKKKQKKKQKICPPSCWQTDILHPVMDKHNNLGPLAEEV